jgi:hypothetical protein
MAITWQTQNAGTTSTATTTSISPSYPSGVTAGDLLLLLIGMKPSVANNGSVTTPTGWTVLGNSGFQGGYNNTIGADTGNTAIFCFSRTADGTETGPITVSLTNNNVSWAQILRLTVDSGSWNLSFNSGGDATGGTTVSASVGSMTISAGDMVITAMCIPTDTATPAQFTAEDLTGTGATFGTWTEHGEYDTALNNDIGGWLAFATASGAGSGVGTVTATASGTTTNVRGPVIAITIHEQASSGTVVLNQASETNSVFSIVATKAKSFSQGTETDIAQTLTLVQGQTVVINQSSETNTSQSLTRIKIQVLGQVNETSTSQVIIPFKTQILNQSTEIVSTSSLGIAKTKLLSISSEVNTAFNITLFGAEVTRRMTRGMLAGRNLRRRMSR